MEETKYQLLKNQKPYRILTAKEIAEFFGISISSARHLCVTGVRYHKIYTIEPLQAQELEDPKKGIPLWLWKEWDEVRLKINPRAKK